MCIGIYRIDFVPMYVFMPISGNGGIECRDHVPLQRRFQETFIGVGVASIFYGLNKWWSTSKRGNPDSLLLLCETKLTQMVIFFPFKKNFICSKAFLWYKIVLVKKPCFGLTPSHLELEKDSLDCIF